MIYIYIHIRIILAKANANAMAKQSELLTKIVAYFCASIVLNFQLGKRKTT